MFDRIFPRLKFCVFFLAFDKKRNFHFFSHNIRIHAPTPYSNKENGSIHLTNASHQCMIAPAVDHQTSDIRLKQQVTQYIQDQNCIQKKPFEQQVLSCGKRSHFFNRYGCIRRIFSNFHGKYADCNSNYIQTFSMCNCPLYI